MLLHVKLHALALCVGQLSECHNLNKKNGVCPLMTQMTLIVPDHAPSESLSV